MTISRRKFLGWCGAAGIGLARGKTAGCASMGEFKGYPDSLGVLHDTTLCIGCRSCEGACNRVNELPEPEKPFTDLAELNVKRRTSAISYTVVNRFEFSGARHVYVKNQCNHCLEPACAAACFVGAFTKTKEGPVVYDASVCVGCRYCMIACPFEIPAFEYNNAFSPRVMKCTLCAPRIRDGLLPGCVEACPTEALSFGKRRDLIRMARQRIISYPGRYVDHIYGEHEMGGTSWLYLSGKSFARVGMREDLGVAPALMFTSGPLSAVPLIASLWPLLIVGIYAISGRKEKLSEIEKSAVVQEAVEKTRLIANADLEKALGKARLEKEAAIEKEVRKALKAKSAPSGGDDNDG